MSALHRLCRLCLALLIWGLLAAAHCYLTGCPPAAPAAPRGAAP